MDQIEARCSAVNRKYCRAVCNCWVVVKRSNRPDYCTRELYPLTTESGGYCGVALATLKKWYGLKKKPAKRVPTEKAVHPKGQVKKQSKGRPKLKWLGK